MKHKTLKLHALLVFFIIMFSCSTDEGITEETKEPDKTSPIEKQDIQVDLVKDIQVFEAFEISGSLSKTGNIEVFIDDTSIFKKDNISNFSFELDPTKYPVGETSLKFIASGSSSEDTTEKSIAFNIVRKILSVEFEPNFIDARYTKFHIIASDSKGNLIDNKTLSSENDTIIDIISNSEINDDTVFQLTFVSNSSNQIFDFYVYGDLTKAIVGDKISFKTLLHYQSSGFPEIAIPFYDPSYYIRAAGTAYSMVYINDKLSGNIGYNYLNGLASGKAFIQYYNDNIIGSYKYAFIDDIWDISVLQEEDFTSTNVVQQSIEINGSNRRPFLSIHGFENEDHFNVISDHMLYWNPSLKYSLTNNKYNYEYADIFPYTLYSFEIGNYGLTGVGVPPNVIDVPNKSIDYSFTNGELNFVGVPNYEVGRLRMSKYENSHINVEFIFNGESSKVIIPKLPEGVFPSDVYETFANENLDLIQGVAENYTSFDSYKDYISNVLVSSTPFYINSPLRERIVKSSVGPNLLPIFEFPYSSRF